MILSPYCGQTAQTHDETQGKCFYGVQKLQMNAGIVFCRLSHTQQHNRGVFLCCFFFFLEKCVFPKQKHSNSDTLSDPLDLTLHVSQLIADCQPIQTLCNALCRLSSQQKKLDRIVQTLEQIHVVRLIHQTRLWKCFVQLVMVCCLLKDSFDKVEVCVVVRCVSDSGGNNGEAGGLCRKSALRHSRREKRKRERRGGGGWAGARRGERGVCLHWPS